MHTRWATAGAVLTIAVLLCGILTAGVYTMNRLPEKLGRHSVVSHLVLSSGRHVSPKPL